MKTRQNQISFKLFSFLLLLTFIFSGCVERPLLLRNRPNVPPPSLDPNSEDIPDAIVGSPMVIMDVEKDITPAPVTDIKSAPLTHTVKKGESFWKIARMYGVSNSELALCNNLAIDKPLKIGTVLVIPPGGVANYKAPPPRKSPVRTRPVLRKKVIKPANSGTYTVQKGDSLWKISRRHNISTQALIDANGIDRRKPIMPGMKLLIPGSSPAHVKTQTVETETTEVISVPVKESNAAQIQAGRQQEDDGANDALNELLNDAENAAGDKGKKDDDPSGILAGLDEEVTKADLPIAGDLYTEEVLPNETLQEIAERHGLKVEDILKVNPGLKANQKLKPFSSIKIPNKKF